MFTEIERERERERQLNPGTINNKKLLNFLKVFSIAINNSHTGF
jgi:hypothetical protein